MTNRHIDDDAEFYALGLLDEHEARAVEEHAAECGACADRLAAALRTVASLADALPDAGAPARLERRIGASLRAPATPRGSPSRIASLAVAAVFAAAFVGVGANDLALRAHESAADLALVTIAGSHFNHVTATANPGSGVTVKVLYARDGAWLYVIATGTDRDSLHVIEHDAAGRTADLGALVANGESSSLFLRPSSRVGSVAIEDRGRTVATAKLSYESIR